MATILIEIPEGKRAEWVNNVLTLVDDKPKVEFKFKVGDKVIREGHILTIRSRYSEDEMPCYITKENGCVYYESELEPYTQPQDITERIKTFEDARKWCCLNGKGGLVSTYDDLATGRHLPPDIIAYLKLRIITCALNEGWEPRPYHNDMRYYAIMNDQCTDIVRVAAATDTGASTPHTLYFKTKELAAYAATQFKDIYMDFCYNGKE